VLQVDEVKNIMSDNIEAVLSRGEKLDLLVDKTDNLMFEVSRGGDQSNHSRALCSAGASGQQVKKPAQLITASDAMLHCSSRVSHTYAQ
jgi:hypothetical protein